MDFLKNKAKPVGLPPGALFYTGTVDPDEVVALRHVAYNSQEVITRDIDDFSHHFDELDEQAKHWISLTGLHDGPLLQRLGDKFSLHPLVLEDIMNLQQRTKFEDYDNCLFLTMMLPRIKSDNKLETIHLAMVIGKHWVLSFQEREDNIFTPVLERIKAGKGLLRTMPAGYLAYALIDTVVDHYFFLTEKIGEDIEAAEDSLLHNFFEKTFLNDINRMKKWVVYLWRILAALREMVGQMVKTPDPVLDSKVRVYLRDVQDHIFQLVELTEMLRERLNDLTNFHLAHLSNRMNVVMKTLTIIGSIFIPLTFIAGIYGMNFDYMPELRHHYGYPIILGVMGLVSLVLLVFFKIKDWM